MKLTRSLTVNIPKKEEAKDVKTNSPRTPTNSPRTPRDKDASKSPRLYNSRLSSPNLRSKQLSRILSLDPVYNYKVIERSFDMTIELLNNDSFFEKIKNKQVCTDFFELIFQLKRPIKFINFCLNEELKKKDYSDIFRENTPCNNCILSFMNTDNNDFNLLSVYVTKLIKDDQDWTNDIVLYKIDDIVQYFFEIIKYYPSTFYYVLDYIIKKAQEHDKDPVKIITILLFLRIVNPSITNCLKDDDNNICQNKLLLIVKTILAITNELVSDEIHGNLEKYDITKINNLKKDITGRLSEIKIIKNKINYSECSLNIESVINLCDHVITHFHNLQKDIVENGSNNEFISNNILKIVNMIKCEVKSNHIIVSDEHKIILKKLCVIKFTP